MPERKEYKFRKRPGRPYENDPKFTRLRDAIRAGADSGKRLLAGYAEAERAQLRYMQDLRGTPDEPHKSVLAIITGKTGVSFPRPKDEQGNVLHPDTITSYSGRIQFPRVLDSQRWKGEILEPQFTPEGQVMDTLVIRVEPKSESGNPDLKRVVTIAYTGEHMEVKRGDEVIYDERFSYQDYVFGQIRSALDVAFTPPMSEGDRLHRDLMDRLKRPQ